MKAREALPGASMATAKPQPMPVAGPESGDAATPPGLPLAAPLRLNRLALDIDAGASDFGERLCRLSADNEPCQTRSDIFRPGQPVETLNNPETLSGEDVLPGFGFEAKPLRFAGHGRLSGNGD